MTGVTPSGSGSRASHEAASASSPEASIPNAVAALQLVPRSVFDQWGDLDLGEPEQAWACAVDRFKKEARINRQCAEQMQRTAIDADEQAKRHFERAYEFDNLARAIEGARITFPASGIETEGHDPEEGHGAEHESPTAESGDAQ